MSANKKIMIVEDDAFLSFVEEKIVTRLGYDVVGKASSGEETLRKVNQINPDILLIDVQLSGSMDGVQTVETLRKRHFNKPVIFISGCADKSITDRVNKLEDAEYLVKPIDMNMLKKPLKNAERSQGKTYSAA